MPSLFPRDSIICSFGCPGKNYSRLPDGDLDIFFAETNSLKPYYEELQDLLSTEERNKAGKIIITDTRETFVIAHALLRMTLAEHLNVAPSSISYVVNHNGKPSISGNPVFFNLSHTSNAFVLGLSKTNYLGIDIEEVKPATDFASIVRSFFSLTEQKAVFQDEAESRELFFLFWTRKEALLKSLGAGITSDLRGIEVASDRNFIDKSILNDMEVKNTSGEHYIFSKKIDKYILSSSTPFIPSIQYHNIEAGKFKPVQK